MSEMIRKQMYIRQRDQAILTRLSRARGVSEAEVVRQAIEREALGRDVFAGIGDASAWDGVLEFVAARKAATDGQGAYAWSRQDAYDERESQLAGVAGE